MQRSDNVRPIIIKRKKVVSGDGHHGGAWKVAYADFVTAMMAFFLMLWLLGSVEDEQRKGIADYFSDIQAVQSQSSGGDGVMGGEALSQVESLAEALAEQEISKSDLEALDTIVDAIETQIAGDELLGEAFEHVAIRMTDEGLLIELFDLEDRPLFNPDDGTPRPVLIALADVLSNAFSTVTNPVAVQTHSRSFPTVFLQNPVWDLTISRAITMQRLMLDQGLPESRIHRVTGNADRAPAISPTTAARNNRVELILLLQSDQT
ncbi:MAG: chemotaxis protein MotB [Rhodobacteraceae bacterium]|nr:MAG: chemotaxis protein MotB [Paracoccaceae bacterium]